MIDKKSTVLKAATKLFAERGFDNTSVANICDVANVSKGLVYHHFKSKDEILIEIFTQTTAKMVEMNNKPVSYDTPVNKLIDLIKSIFSQLESDKLFFQLNLNVMFQPSTKKLLASQIKERSSILLASVKSIFYEIDSKQSTVLSFIFIAEIDGIALDYLSVFEDYPLQKIQAHLINKYKDI